MMDNQNDRSKKSIALGLVIIAGLVWLFWYLLSNNFNLFAGLMAGLTPSMITIYLQRENQKREHQNWILRNKDAFLIEIIDIYTSLLGPNKKQDVEKRLRNIQPALLAHGSGGTLKAWEEMASLTKGESPDAIIRRGERFFRALRKDLGRDDSKVRAGAVWAIILKPEDRQKAFDACKGEKYD